MGNAVDMYIGGFGDERTVRLQTMQRLVHELVPGAAESMSYGLVGYKLNGKPLVYFGAFPKHIGLYTTPNGHEHFKDDFAPYKQGKGSVQFPLDQPLPIDLIRRVIAYRKRVLEL